MTTADQVIAQAASQVGYYEVPGGTRSRFETWYGMSGPWCAMGLTWAFAAAGATIFPRHAFTPDGVKWFQAHGQWEARLSEVRRGDVVYFDFPGAPARVSHVGLVESVNSDGSVNTIEFNTSIVIGGSQRNGGAVARKRRKAWIVGFGRPAYTAAPVVHPLPAPTPAPAPAPVSGRKDYYQQGDHGYVEIGTLQATLNSWYPGLHALAVDRDYGPKTKARVIYFQSRAGLVADGIAGNKTLRKLGIR